MRKMENAAGIRIIFPFLKEEGNSIFGVFQSFGVDVNFHSRTSGSPISHVIVRAFNAIRDEKPIHVPLCTISTI